MEKGNRSNSCFSFHINMILFFMFCLVLCALWFKDCSCIGQDNALEDTVKVKLIDKLDTIIKNN